MAKAVFAMVVTVTVAGLRFGEPEGALELTTKRVDRRIIGGDPPRAIALPEQ